MAHQIIDVLDELSSAKHLMMLVGMAFDHDASAEASATAEGCQVAQEKIEAAVALLQDMQKIREVA